MDTETRDAYVASALGLVVGLLMYFPIKKYLFR